jgi:type I restriction enzyme M protein
MDHFSDKVNLIWDIADTLRGPYRPPEYRKVMLPMTVLRRLDCVLDPTKQQVLETQKKWGGKAADALLRKAARQSFYNTSKLDFERLKGDSNNIAPNLLKYIRSFSPNVRAIFEYFGFDDHVAKLDKSNRLFLIVSKFAAVDLHPEAVPNHQMGLVFEELVRKFNEAANEEAGDHFTPREVIKLMVNILFDPDDDILTHKGIIRTLYDPTCGTGGMLTVGSEHLHHLNPDAQLILFGQDYNPEAYAICCADMLIKGNPLDNIKFGDTLGDGKTEDYLPDHKFHYMLANPPFGVKWEPEKDTVVKEHDNQGYDGRFGPGYPRINDGSFLFLQHMISKMQPYAHRDRQGSRIGIVFNGSPLFTGDAGSGESEIRRWIIENDWLEAIVALPDQLFYNTGISTYIWIVTNRKARERKGRIQLINAVDFYRKMRKSLGNKRNQIGDPDQIAEITRIYGEFQEGEHCKIFDNDDFAFRKITVERPLRLSFAVTPERIEALKISRPFEALATSKKKGKEAAAEIEAGLQLQKDLLACLASLSASPVGASENSPWRKPWVESETTQAPSGAEDPVAMDTTSHPPGTVWKSRPDFEIALDAALDANGLRIPAPLRKAVLSALGELDETAEICLNPDGNPEPDPDLRDTENVPLKEDIHAYFDREVKPHVPDAWIDESKTKVGYDIPFTQLFFREQVLPSIQTVVVRIEQSEAILRVALNNLVAALGRPETSAPCNFAQVRLPAGWSRNKLGFLATVKARLGWKGLKAEEYVDEGYIFLSTPNIKESEIDFENVNHITRERYVESPEIMLEVGDVLIAKDGSTLGICNVVRQLPAPATVNSSIAVVRPSAALDSVYLYYLFRSHPFQLLVSRMKGGMGVPHLFQADLRKFEVLLPPRGVQAQIGAYLDTHLGLVSRLYPPAEALTGAPVSGGLLFELQQSLITAAVTGQLDIHRHEKQLEALA